MGRRRALLLAVGAALVVVPLVLVLLLRPAGASSSHLTLLNGTAELARSGAAFARATDGEILQPNDRVRTLAASHALITFFDGSTLEMEPSTEVAMEEATPRGSAISIRLTQSIGRTWSNVAKLVDPNSVYQIKTPAATATVRGTGLDVNVAADGTTTVSVTDGQAIVSAQGVDVTVTAGTQTTVAPGQPPTPPTPVPTPPSKLRFSMRSPAFLAVVHDGRACGIVMPGPTVVRQIPGCLATEPGVEPQLVDVPNAGPGTYDLVITPDGPGGPFSVTASGLVGDTLAFNFVRTGTAAPGQILGSALPVEAAPGGGITAAGLSDVTVIATTPVKAVLPSGSPRPTAAPVGGAAPTPPSDLFSPLPRIGFSIGPVITPAPLSVASPTPAATPPPPSPTAAATPTPPPPSPTPAPTPPPTPAPPPSPTLAPLPIPTLTVPPLPTPTVPPPTPTLPLPTSTLAPTLAPSPAPTAPLPTPSATPGPGHIILTASPATIANTGSSTSTIVASYVSSAGAALTAASPITVSLSLSSTACCTLTTATTTIPAGQTTSSASPGVVTSTQTTGSALVSGTATGAIPVTSTTVTSAASQQIVLPAVVVAASTVSFDVTLTTPAGAGGVVVSLSSIDTAVGTVPSSVTVPQGSSTATATFTGLTTGVTTITATASGYSTATTLGVVETRALTFSESLVVPVGQTVTRYVESSSAAPPGGIVVQLAQSGALATLSTSGVVIPAGQLRSNSFTITGITQGSGSLTASATGATSASSTLTVQPAPSITLFSTSAVGAGLYRSSVSLSLSAPAPSGGVTVSLSSGNTGVATVQDVVFIPAGSSSGSFRLTGVAPGSAPVTATAAGYSAGTQTYSIATPTFTFSGIDTSQSVFSLPDSFTVFTSTPGCGNCDRFAHNTPITFTVNSATTGIVTVASVTGSVEQLSASATIGTPTATGTFTITASATGFTAASSSTVTVAAPVITLSSITPVGAGLQRTVSLSLSDPAPTGGLAVGLVSSSPSVATTVPTSVAIPAGSSSTTYVISGLTTGTTTITGSASGWTSGSTGTVTVVTPTFVFSGIDTSQATNSSPDSFFVYVKTPGSGSCSFFLPVDVCDVATSAITVTFGHNGPVEIASFTTGSATVAAGSHSSGSDAVQPFFAGSFQVTASATGFTTALSSSVGVAAPSLRLYDCQNSSEGPLTVGATRKRVICVEAVDGPSTNITINLSSSNTTVATVPTSVTIVGTTTTASFSITTSGLGSTTITATHAATFPGWTSDIMTVNTVTPTFTFSGLALQRNTLSASDTFTVYSFTPGNGECDDFTGGTSVTLTVSSSPSGIASVGSPVTPPADQCSFTATVGTPTATGTYTVSAAAAGSTTSPPSSTVTVATPTIYWSSSSATIGAGLITSSCSFYVYLQEPAPTGGVTVQLRSSDPTIVSTPSTVSIPASSTSACVQLTGVTPGIVQLSASAPGYLGAVMGATSVTPTFTFSGVNTGRTTASSSDSFTMFISVNGCTFCGSVVATATTVNLSITSATAGIVTLSSATVTISANGSSVSASVGTPTAAGTYSIVASATGFTTARSSTVVVITP